jgi:hypothetical protein
MNHRATNPTDHHYAKPLGDTGDGDTGVPNDAQGISNRPGDKDPERDEKEGDDDERRPKPIGRDRPGD